VCFEEIQDFSIDCNAIYLEILYVMKIVWVVSVSALVKLLKRLKKGAWSFVFYRDGLVLCSENFVVTFT
jgi:hypothetical protein